MSETARLVVLASGSGTNFQAILNACENNILPAEVLAVVSDQQDAYALERSKTAGITTHIHLWKPYKIARKRREDYDADLAQIISAYQPDYVVLAGWMRLLSMAFLSIFPMQVINLHPALPGCFPGTHAIERAFEAFKKRQIKETGVMVHFVPDEGIDDGPVIVKKHVPIYKEDTLELLEERIHQAEHKLLVTALNQVIETKFN